MNARHKLSVCDEAKHYLARMMMNQVGEEWEDCCNSVDFFIAQQGDISENELTSRLYGEACRYEDM